MRAGLPYRVVGGTRFYERKEIKDALAYLRALSNPDDDVNVRRILNEPKRGIGAKSESVVAEYASANRISFYAAARQVADIPGLGAAAVKKYAEFVRLMDDLAQIARTEPAATCLEAVLEQTGYLAALRASKDYSRTNRAWKTFPSCLKPWSSLRPRTPARPGAVPRTRGSGRRCRLNPEPPRQCGG